MAILTPSPQGDPTIVELGEYGQHLVAAGHHDPAAFARLAVRHTAGEPAAAGLIAREATPWEATSLRALAGLALHDHAVEATAPAGLTRAEQRAANITAGAPYLRWRVSPAAPGAIPITRIDTEAAEGDPPGAYERRCGYCPESQDPYCGVCSDIRWRRRATPCAARPQGERQ